MAASAGISGLMIGNGISQGFTNGSFSMIWNMIVSNPVYLTMFVAAVVVLIVNIIFTLKEFFRKE